jgi:hypothetical protein
MHWMIGNAREHVGKPSPRVNIIHLGGHSITMRLYITAARSPPRSEPAKSRGFLPRAIPRALLPPPCEQEIGVEAMASRYVAHRDARFEALRDDLPFAINRPELPPRAAAIQPATFLGVRHLR